MSCTSGAEGGGDGSEFDDDGGGGGGLLTLCFGADTMAAVEL